MLQTDPVDPARWRAIQDLFYEALEQPKPDRASFLERVCPGDTALQENVLALLSADAGADIAFDLSTLVYELFEDDEDAYVGRAFGPYRLQRLLGQGGMGKVFLAERLDYGGSVAVKLLHDVLSPERRQRFVTEQKILAQLNHPSIARLYDAGTLPDGTPFFAMECVEGLPLVEYCTRNGLSVPGRLQLFREVCGAVQFAHQHGIIHRDLKPSNILVRDDGAVKLLDFGIAAPMDVSDAGQDAQHPLRFLTRAYAAPEQIRGHVVTVQSDVYALGIILQELLQDDSIRPTPKKADRGDLQAICLKATHLELSQRYASAEALLRDVDRFLAGDTVEARQPFRLAYRVRKFSGKNARQLTAAACVFAILAALVGYYTIRLTRARERAESEAARTLAVQRFVLSLFTANDDSAGPSEDLKVVTLIDRGEKEVAALENHPAVQAELYQTLGNINDTLGRYDRARGLLQLALEKQTKAYGRDQPQVAESMLGLASVSRDMASLQEAEQWVRRAVEIDRRALPAGDTRLAKAETELGSILIARGSYAEAVPLLRRCLEQQTAANAPARDVGDTVTELAIAEFYLGDYAQSKALNQRALDIDRQIHGPYHPDVASDYLTLANIEKIQGHYPEAERDARAALSIDEKWFSGGHSEVASAMTNLAQTLTAQGKNAEAESLLTKALKIQEQQQTAPHNRTGVTLSALGNLEFMRGDLKAAEEHFSECVQIFRSVYEGRHFSIGVGLSGLGRVYFKQKQYGKSEQMFRQALDMFTKTIPPANINNGLTELDYGKLLLAEKRYSEAGPMLLNSYKVFLKQSEPPMEKVSDARAALVEFYIATGNPHSAELYRRKISAAELSRAAKQ